MRLRAQQILIPCVTFGARARLAADAGTLTPIELIVLKAIGGGLDEVPALTQVLELGQRPVLDLIYDFWLKGYVVVDTSEAKVRLAGEAAKAHQGGGLERLATAENNLEVVSLVQELVSGAVLPHIGLPHPFGPESALVPTLRSGLSLERVTRGELLDAVQREVERQSRKLGRPLVAHEAWVEPDQLLLGAGNSGSPGQQRRFLPVLVDVAQDSDSGLLFEVVDAPDVPPPVRREIARNLSKLAELLPDQLFFKRWRQEFERAPTTDAPSVGETALERLGRAVRSLEGTDPGVLVQRHEQVLRLHREAGFEVRAKARTEATVRAVAGYDEHESVIRRLLLEAEYQIVLGNPWVRLEALLERLPGGDTSWFDLLEKALARGVQIFLMWGIRPDEKLNPRVRNALVDLAARNPGRFLVSERSSTLHGKFVIRDAHQMLVTSYNFLDPPDQRDSLEVGLLVEGTAPGISPAAVLDLLEWARNTFPDYLLGQRLLLLPDELGAEEPSLPSIAPPPEEPAPATMQGDAAAAAPAIRHWAHAWAAAYEALRALGCRYSKGADLVVDREHREALWQSLSVCGRRLAVLSDKLSVDVVSDRFTRLLKARLEGGASCAIVYRREGASDTHDGPTTRLRALARDYGSSFFLVGSRSHAKILVSDDEVTVGSFNFLSYGGDYEGGAERRQRAEISVRVRDASLVDKVLEDLACHWPDAFAPLVRRRGVILEPALGPRGSPDLQPLFRELGTAHDAGEPLLQWFGATKTPWRDLDELQRAGLPEELLGRAAGAAIARADDLDGADGTRWRCWLAEHRWKQTDFIGSAILLPESARGELGLERWLAQLGAAAQAPALSAPTPPGIHDLRAGEAEAAALLMLVAVLEHGRSDFLESLEVLHDLLPGRFRAWIDAARAYHDEALQPLPMSLLRRSVRLSQRRQEIDQARREFRRALESAENVGFRFPLGEHTWKRLRMPGYLLGTMRSTLESNDSTELGQYIAQLDRAGKNVERLMDDASSEVRDEHNQQITEPKRSACLKRLRCAFEGARTWVHLSSEPEAGTFDARVLTACWTLKRALAELPVAEALELAPLAEPARRFVLTRLDPLFSADEP